MARSDFAWVTFNFRFDAANPQATRSFDIEGTPLNSGNGYLMIQGLDVENGDHRILINGRDLPSFDIAEQSVSSIYTTWMDRVPQSYLRNGDNTITIRRATTSPPDTFTVANVMVQWRELG